MKDFLNKRLNEIKHLSLKLDKLAKLYDQPWIIYNENQDFVKLIFLKDNKLLISENGIVTEGKWQLLNQTNSILLEINNNLRLYNHVFVDENIMVFKLDGKSKDYFILINQLKIPNLDVLGYLTLKYQNFNLKSNAGNKIVELNNIPNLSKKDIYRIRALFRRNDVNLNIQLRNKIESLTNIYLDIDDISYIKSILKGLERK